MSSRIAGVQSLYISDTTIVVSICSWFGLEIIPRLVFLHPVCHRHFRKSYHVVPDFGGWAFSSFVIFMALKSGCHGKAIHIWWYVHSFGTEFLPRQVFTTAIEYRPMCPFAREDLPTSPSAWCLPDKDRKPTVDSDDGEDASIMVKLACFQLTFATYSPNG